MNGILSRRVIYHYASTSLVCRAQHHQPIRVVVESCSLLRQGCLDLLCRSVELVNDAGDVVAVWSFFIVIHFLFLLLVVLRLQKSAQPVGGDRLLLRILVNKITFVLFFKVFASLVYCCGDGCRLISARHRKQESRELGRGFREYQPWHHLQLR